MLQQWTPDLENQREKIDKIPVWVKLWDIPKELWGDDDKGLNIAACHVGDPKMMDWITKQRKRLDFSRVCVVISTDQELKTMIPVDSGRPSIFKV